ncbi:MAG: hypothetical protein ABEI06_05075 [Halobacteriaceae archaeon]
MNRYFEDARYYLKRAGETAKKGVEEELQPIEDRFRKLTGKEAEPEPTRLEKIQQDIKQLEKKAEGEAKKKLEDARGRIKEYRNS